MDGKNILLGLLCINILLYLSGFQLTQDDLLSKMTNKDELDTGNFGLNQNVEDKIPKDPGTGEITGGSGLAFVDVVLMFWDFIKVLFNLVTAPIALFTVGLHPTISIMIGIPYMVATLLVVVQFARGANL